MGYTRMQRALKSVGNRVAHSTLARILRAEDIHPSTPPDNRRTFVQAHCCAPGLRNLRLRGLGAYYAVAARS